jgi:hypothetical protein
MGGVAADMSMRLSRGVISEPRRERDLDNEYGANQIRSHEKQGEYYEVKRQYRDSASASASSTDFHARAL